MKRAVIYARISVTTEESVSVERQIESAQKYAEARGWSVVGTFTDDGVSATKNRPEDRTGWRALLDSPTTFDVVIVWKVDRLARKVLDFLHADGDLQQRGAGLLAVEDPIDMTTPQGRAFATMLAVFAEMEAAAISARAMASRRHLLHNGRATGGAVPYGWKTVDNPDGPGVVLAQDPDRIEFVRGAAQRTLAGATIHSTTKWLDEVGAPLPRNSQGKRKRDGWRYRTVEQLLRNPVLAGMTPFNPGGAGQRRGDDVVRGRDGLPVVAEDIAVMSVDDWRAMIDLLDNRERAKVQPRAAQIGSRSSALLSRLVYCGDPRHGDDMPRMHRAKNDGREGYSCKGCHQQITSFEPYVIEEFLRVAGPQVRWTKIEEVREGGATLLPEIERRLDELDGLIRDAKTREQRAALQAQQATLLDERDRRRAETPVVSWRAEPAGTFAAGWAAAESDAERRAVPTDAVERLVVRRGRPGRLTRAKVLARLEFQWGDTLHTDDENPGEQSAPTERISA